jgi:hypothetical protein
MFKEKYEFRAGLSYGNSGVNLQTGFSFTKHFGVIASGSYVNVKSSSSSLYQRYGELGFGYFQSLEKTGAVNFEVFSGLGFGEAHSTDDYFTSLSERGKYYKVFIQPDVAFTLGWINLALAVRINYLRFTGYSNLTEHSSAGIPASIGIEPAATLLMGDTPFKLKYQLGLSAQGMMSSRYFGYQPLFMSIGFVISF